MSEQSLLRAGVIGVGAALALSTAAIAEPMTLSPMPTASACADEMHVVKFKGVTGHVTQAQLDAYNHLPAAIRARMGAPHDGQVLSAEAISGLRTHEMSTVMCPW